MMLVSLTVGKVDAGVTVLLTQDKRLIEFPSILLPQNISSGSIVDITVGRNSASELATEAAFRELQDHIYTSFGADQPETPVLRCLNATQTSVVLEWNPIRLATADLISLALYRNGQKAGNIPRPLQMHSTKISGLAVDTEYSFHLVLRTTAGTMSSEKVVVKTHKMTDLSGITITTGILPAATRERLSQAVERIGAKMVDSVRIDTTHFVTTEGRGIAWEKAAENNIPVVRPEWVEACEKSGRILGVTKFYLDAMRPGPTTDETSASLATSTAAPPQSPPPEPVPKGTMDSLPAQHGGGGSGEGEGEGDGTTRSRNGDSRREDGAATGSDTSSSNSHEDRENAVTIGSRGDDQKMRLEEKDDQKVALRPGGPSAKTSSEGGHENERKPQASPDGSSFQEVEL